MFYCPTCKNTYDISKDVVKPQTGGTQIDYDYVVQNVANPEVEKTIKDTNFSMELLTKSVEFRKLSKSQKEYIYNKVLYILPDDKKMLSTDIKEGATAYFHCKNCSNTEEIKPGTRVYGISTDNHTSVSNKNTSKEMIHSDILPITRKYTCANAQCISHTDPSKREAKFFRVSNSYKIKFICIACETIF